MHKSLPTQPFFVNCVGGLLNSRFHSWETTICHSKMSTISIPFGIDEVPIIYNQVDMFASFVLYNPRRLCYVCVKMKMLKLRSQNFCLGLVTLASAF